VGEEGGREVVVMGEGGENEVGFEGVGQVLRLQRRRRRGRKRIGSSWVAAAEEEEEEKGRREDD
jgi:hypothetical protein